MSARLPIVATAGAMAALVLATAAPVGAAAPPAVRVSVSDSEAQTSNHSWALGISGTGRFLVFYSGSPDLVVGDDDDTFDCYLRDVKNGRTTLMSLLPDVTPDACETASVSATGRYVAFQTGAQLVAEDTNGWRDIYVRDRTTGTTTLATATADDVALDSGVLRSWSFSADGRHLAFGAGGAGIVANDTNNATDIFVRDLDAGTTVRVSVSSAEAQTTGDSSWPSISADGSRVAFISDAADLVSNDTNRFQDVFLRDLTAGTTKRVSVAADGSQLLQGGWGAAISGDGRHVAFLSLNDGVTPGDKNHIGDWFVRDLATKQTRLVTITPKGGQFAASGGVSAYAGISDDGSVVVFGVDTMVDENQAIYARDRAAGRTIKVGRALSGIPMVLSGDGRFVGLTTAVAMVANDTNGKVDVYRVGPIR